MQRGGKGLLGSSFLRGQGASEDSSYLDRDRQASLSRMLVAEDKRQFFHFDLSLVQHLTDLHLIFKEREGLRVKTK